MINMSDPSSGETPAYVAAANGHFDILAFLTKSGADLNWAGDNGLTPAQGVIINTFYLFKNTCFSKWVSFLFSAQNGCSI